MKKNGFFIVLALMLTGAFTLQAQYDIELEKEVACTSVKSQDKTGTCWSFATCSFLESELIRVGKGHYDLSEMFVVKNIYKDKAQNYVLRQGKANFSQGSLSHDFVNTVARHGIVPEDVYSGKLDPTAIHNHSEMVSVLKGYLDGLIKQKRLSPKWMEGFEGVLDTYIGDYPTEFEVEGKKYTPQSFAMSLGLNPANYINITSFTHHPFYDQFVLEIPDNFSNQSYINIPIDELTTIVDHAISEGYTVAWDGDVSEKGFSSKYGLAILPEDAGREDLFKNPGEELEVTQASRQEGFESYATTDDHLMHITGIAKDQKGNKYYRIKNSWGEIGELKGYLYMSAAYFRAKTVAIMVNKASVPKDLAAKMTM